MRISQNAADRLVLRGVPGGAIWMVVCVLLGVAVMAAAGFFAWATYDDSHGLNLQRIPLGIGMLMGLALFLVGAVTLAVGRLTLVFDRPAGAGRYEVVSPVVEAGRSCEFRLEHVDSLVIERTEEDRPHEVGEGPGGRMEATVYRLKLRLRKPRRAITLDETENGQTERIDRLAPEVAEWLGVEAPVCGADEV